MDRSGAYRSSFSSALSDMLNGGGLHQRGGPLYTSHLKGSTGLCTALRQFVKVEPFSLSETPMGGIDDISLENLTQLMDTAYDAVTEAADGDMAMQASVYTNVALATQSYMSDLQEKLNEFALHRHANSRAVLDQLSRLDELCQEKLAGLAIDPNQFRVRYPLVSRTVATEADIDFPPYA